MKDALEAYQYNVLNLASNSMYLERLCEIVRKRLEKIISVQPENLHDEANVYLKRLGSYAEEAKAFLDRIDSNPMGFSKEFILKLEGLARAHIFHIRRIDNTFTLLRESITSTEEVLEPKFIGEVRTLSAAISRIYRPIVRPKSSSLYYGSIDYIYKEVTSSQSESVREDTPSSNGAAASDLAKTEPISLKKLSTAKDELEIKAKQAASTDSPENGASQAAASTNSPENGASQAAASRDSTENDDNQGDSGSLHRSEDIHTAPVYSTASEVKQSVLESAPERGSKHPDFADTTEGRVRQSSASEDSIESGDRQANDSEGSTEGKTKIDALGAPTESVVKHDTSERPTEGEVTENTLAELTEIDYLRLNDGSGYSADNEATPLARHSSSRSSSENESELVAAIDTATKSKELKVSKASLKHSNDAPKPMKASMTTQPRKRTIVARREGTEYAAELRTNRKCNFLLSSSVADINYASSQESPPTKRGRKEKPKP